MAKRKTKAQREAEQKAALRQRVADIVAGAAGEDRDDDDCYVIYVTEMSRLTAAVEARFGLEAEHPALGRWNLDEWETVGSLTDLLWRFDVRA